MANSGDEIYAVHQCGGDCWEDAYDYVLAAFTSMSRAVSYIERDLGAYECSHGDSREWHRWSLCVFKGDEYEYWGPMDDSEDGDDLDDEDDDFEPTHPFGYVFEPDECTSFKVERFILDSKMGEQNIEGLSGDAS